MESESPAEGGTEEFWWKSVVVGSEGRSETAWGRVTFHQNYRNTARPLPLVTLPHTRGWGLSQKVCSMPRKHPSTCQKIESKSHLIHWAQGPRPGEAVSRLGLGNLICSAGCCYHVTLVHNITIKYRYGPLQLTNIHSIS